MMMFNHVINFYLYLISGSKFKSDLKTLFGCNKSKTTSQTPLELEGKENTSSEGANIWFGGVVLFSVWERGGT